VLPKNMNQRKFLASQVLCKQFLYFLGATKLRARVRIPSTAQIFLNITLQAVVAQWKSKSGK
jgi:hypothetical protein